MVKFFVILSVLLFQVFVAAVHAQDRTCNLKLKVFSYEKMNEVRSRIVNIEVRVKGKGVDQTRKLREAELESTVEGLAPGKYRLTYAKDGYKSREKQFTLDCGVVDQQNSVSLYAYLWRKGSTADPSPDLIADPKDSRATDKTIASDGLTGSVKVQILIDEDGNVIEASKVSGDKHLAEKAVLAAKRAKFLPTLISGEPHQVSGTLVYNFVP